MQKFHIICNCHQVSFEEIQEAINAGAIRFKDIQELTGASMGCRRCVAQLKQILNKRSI